MTTTGEIRKQEKENECDNQEQLATEEDSLDESPRKLASVTTIKAIRPIAGADKILLARFTTNSWQTIISVEDKFKVGDKAVFFEIDSFLPKEERYNTLEGRCNKVMKEREGYRLKSIKLRGEISQGFAMPIHSFPELDQTASDNTDVTDILGVKLYQLPIASGRFGFNIGRPKGGFPHFVKKTDQSRIQSMGNREIMDLFNHIGFEISEKVDGTSATFALKYNPQKVIGTPEDYVPDNPNYFTGADGEIYRIHYDFHVCSRNLDLKP